MNQDKDVVSVCECILMMLLFVWLVILCCVMEREDSNTTTTIQPMTSEDLMVKCGNLRNENGFVLSRITEIFADAIANAYSLSREDVINSQIDDWKRFGFKKMGFKEDNK